jgi:hypothetical protein
VRCDWFNRRTEDQAMNKNIGAAGRHGRAEEMIPFIENVGQPEMKLFFLARYSVDGFSTVDTKVRARIGSRTTIKRQ